MFKQPHIHHEGPITVELCEGLIRSFVEMEKDIPVECPVDSDVGWDRCRDNWILTLEYATHRLHEVVDDLVAGQPMDAEYHGKIIDICLSIKDDFAHARGINFVQPEGSECKH